MEKEQAYHKGPSLTWAKSGSKTWQFKDNSVFANADGSAITLKEK